MSGQLAPLRTQTLSCRFLGGILGGLLILVGAGAARAFDSESVDFLGAWPFGPASTVAIDAARELAFYGAGGAVIVTDIADLAAPVPFPGEIRTRGRIEDLWYDPPSQRLFIAGGDGGLEIWDVSTPESPEQLSRLEVEYFDVEVPVGAVCVRGNFAYISTSFGYVHWIDVSARPNRSRSGRIPRTVSGTSWSRTTLRTPLDPPASGFTTSPLRPFRSNSARSRQRA